MEEIYPRSAVGNQKLYIFGTHRISDLGDERSNGAGQVKYFLVGDKVCSLLDVDQEFDDEFNPSSREGISCNTFLHQVADEYEFTELLNPGLAKHSLRTKQTSLFTGRNYTQRVVPQIT